MFPELPVLSFDDAKELLGLKQGDNVGSAVHMVTDKAKEYLRKKNLLFGMQHIFLHK